MKNIYSIWTTLRQGITQVVFPDLCICCGQESLQKGHHLCPFCLEKRFVHPQSQSVFSTSGVMLPDTIKMQYALWEFDKGGMLQHLIHQLKYEHLTGIGRQLGSAIARRVQHHPEAQLFLDNSSSVLIPVPLHYLKFRKRGFNQAFFIAKGIQDVLSIPICEIDTVRRRKFTKTQTGFSLEKRIDNMQDAFHVSHPERLKGKKLIIVDDVFTTGATSFELARTLSNAGTSEICIWTIAQA